MYEEDNPKPGAGSYRRDRGGKSFKKTKGNTHGAKRRETVHLSDINSSQLASNHQKEVGRSKRNKQLAASNEYREVDDGKRGLRDSESHFDQEARVGRIQRLSRPVETQISIESLRDIINGTEEEVLFSVFQIREPLKNIFKQPIQNPEFIMIIIILISKLEKSPFEQLRLKFVNDLNVCGSGFVDVLNNFFMDLPNMEDKSSNPTYWEHENMFWERFVIFCKILIDCTPPTGLLKYRTLVEATTKYCLIQLKEKHNYSLEVMTQIYFDEMVSMLREKIDQQKNPKQSQIIIHSGAPENFRELSVIPGPSDLMKKQPFLRPNIVKGSYSDVEHYLDVQFRLLREDCFGPLREGILQYVEEANRKSYDNIRIYRNTKFTVPYLSNTKVGMIVQLDERSNKWLKRVNWAHNKKFIFGSLLLFTKDNCKTFIVTTVADRDPKMLERGMIPVTILHMNSKVKLKEDDYYVMIESEVYLEPYLHVLKALQDPNFPEQLAMKEYIVNVIPTSKHPAYLTEKSKFNIEIHNTIQDENPKTNDLCLDLNVLNLEDWPSNESLGLNKSQKEAFHLALSREFAVIQGPPGTGKTFLGTKIAKTLLENVPHKILMICYTNHALDQFLEALIPFTDSIVRIGGRSRNEAMDKYNLNRLKTKYCLNHRIFKIYQEQKELLKETVFALKHQYNDLDSLQNSVVGYETILEYVPEIEMLKSYHGRKGFGDPLSKWLFEEMQSFNFNSIIQHGHKFGEQSRRSDKDHFNNNEIEIDKLFDDKDYEEYARVNNEIKVSFCLNAAETQLTQTINQFNNMSNKVHGSVLQNEILRLKSQIEHFKKMSRCRDVESRYKLEKGCSPTSMSMEQRWNLYFQWVAIIIKDIKEKMKPLQDSLEFTCMAYEEAQMMYHSELIQDKRVIGMTTSGAARLRKLLQVVAAPIVIVEEAAEVLEAHIVTALTKHCQHLILIGDHQQLRPSAAHMRLAKHFNIEVSLFERMIMNKIHSRRLTVQHRMRPEIAALIAPLIYEDLTNHPSVDTFPDVRGMMRNLFFVSHNHKEEEEEENASKSNHAEGDMVLHFAKYLMQQGYQPQDITILAAYNGQMFYMRKQRFNYPELADVKITVVDNYQGEESKIILLSLVRNNYANKIGFLGIKNRICVALSRSREGLYIFGNIDILKRNSELWQNIANNLENRGCLGTNLRLQCVNHPDQITTIITVDDYRKVPDGGCLLKCNFKWECNHQCPFRCHAYNSEHTGIYCQQPCERSPVGCSLGHSCKQMCYEKCKPCPEEVEIRLPCGHNQKVSCHLKDNTMDFICQTIITVILPICGHETTKLCGDDIVNIECPAPCEFRVDSCGHLCMMKCHVLDDPHHMEYVCEKPCARAKKGCSADIKFDRGNHQCKKLCYENCDDCDAVMVLKNRSNCEHPVLVACGKDPNDIRCTERCGRRLPCGHSCKKPCYQECGGCLQKVKKIIPDCKHEVEVICMENATRAQCLNKCDRIMSCGHVCGTFCKEPCDPKTCYALIEDAYEVPCGHRVKLPCNLYTAIMSGETEATVALKYCKAPCGVELACGHLCQGSCWRCRRGALHVPCTQPCLRPNICGHSCEEPCNQLCPPCSKPCEVRCKHSKCRNKCGVPCTPCQERCARKCKHSVCPRRCSEPCVDRFGTGSNIDVESTDDMLHSVGTSPAETACSETCSNKLSCGHMCVGLCGEPCIPVCRACNPDRACWMDFLGDPYPEDARFVLLEDCQHIMEVDDLENWIKANSDMVKIPSCPNCRRPIVNTQRYKDHVNHIMRTQINPIKEKVFGTNKMIQKEKKKLKLEFKRLTNDCKDTIMKGIEPWNLAFNKVKKAFENNLNKQVSLIELKMISVHLNVLDMICESHELFKKEGNSHLKNELNAYTKILCQVLINNINKLSQQQQIDIANEMNRINCIIQLSKLLSVLQVHFSNDIQKSVKEAKNVVLTCRRFDEKQAIEKLKIATKSLDMVKIVKMERQMIVSALGMKAGHWYKCPNGHIYCITECGGAMEVGKCNECGASIGGTRHRLLADNAHAGEMDNSKFPAWSEQNNLENFNLDP